MSQPHVWCIPTTSETSNNVLLWDPFPVDLDNDEQVFHLKKKIKGANMDVLARVDISREMKVWRCPTLTLYHIRLGEIIERVRKLEFPRDGERLGGWEHIQLSKNEPLVVRILHSLKAKRTRAGDYLESARSSKLARLEPNKLNSASTCDGLQENREEIILDDCPGPDDLPLALMYSGFGEFRDFISDPANYPDTFSKEDKVNELVEAMCHLGFEKDKRARTQHILHHIFAGPQRQFEYSVDNGTLASTDGHVLAIHGGPLLILEFKRRIDFTEGQLASYFLRLALRSEQQVFFGWRQPALGIIIRGTLILFVGLVMLDKQVWVLPLAHPFIANDSDLPDRVPLYATFEAASRLLVRIEQDAARLVTSPPPHISGSHRRLPDVHSLLQSSGSDVQVERINFQIIQKVETGLEGRRHLYLATTDNNQQILIKFSRQYGKELHEFCASMTYAPELLAFERLPGGWFGVAMEYFPSGKRILESEGLHEYGENWLTDIIKVVNAFHTHGYVHGDLRPPNFIVNGDRLLLVDFDWGGKSGEAKFPRKTTESGFTARAMGYMDHQRT